MFSTKTILVPVLCGLALAACQSGKDTDGDGTKSRTTSTASSASQKEGGKSDNGKGSSRGGRAIQVSSILTRTETVPLTLEAQGNVIPLDEVSVLPQKTGTVKEIHIREGQEVRRGQLLFSLDDRDDNANVKRMEANVKASEMTLAAAQRDLARNQDLAARNFVSPSALDASRDKVDSATAALDQNRAALEQARVSQSYTAITAPFDGRAGVINVRPGSLVTATATATPMVKITRMNPIGVSFALPEREFPALMAAQRVAPAKVHVDLDPDHSVRGEVNFIDSSIDRTSGTITVKAKLDNSERRIWPGQYVTVKVVAGEIKDAVVLPTQAVITGPNGTFVYVIKDDQTVAPQPVQLNRVVDQKAILSGIGPGIKVVLEGGQNLRPGSKVTEVKDSGNKSEGRGGRNRRNGQSAPQSDTQSTAQPADAQAKPGKDGSAPGSGNKRHGGANK